MDTFQTPEGIVVNRVNDINQTLFFIEGSKLIISWCRDPEGQAIDQILHLAQLPFAFHHIALMADGHSGFGMPIGGVAAFKNEIIPYAVGKDIGCGLCAVKTSLTEIDTETIKRIFGGSKAYRGGIRSAIPVGFNKHHQRQDEKLMPNTVRLPLGGIVEHEWNNSLHQLGTLGGGNHFIEIQKGSDGHIWVMIHSGSRHLGNEVCDHYNKIAKELNARWHSNAPANWQLAFLPLDSKEGNKYLVEMNFCVEYALANRKLMMDRIKEIFVEHTGCTFETPYGTDMINIAHNYARKEHHFDENVIVHRKGATSAREGEIGIIPGSQGTKSYIVQGKGNEDSFQSCSHGAGRRMSRTAAKATLNLEEERKKMNDKGIVHGMRTAKDLEEADSAYKDIATVMAEQSDLVDVEVELEPLAVIKG